MESVNVYIVDLESVPTRYTCQWKSHIPELLKQHNPNGHNVVNISGGEHDIKATPGAFLNFQQTNIYKNTQLNDIAQRFSSEVKAGDRFVFADAWHPGIIQLKYMSELLQIPVEIHALWHAGSYDPQDFLGRLIEDKRWSNSFEQSLFHAIDYNWFATKFHTNMFRDNVFSLTPLWEIDKRDGEHKFSQTGWPMGYLRDELAPFDGAEKEDIVLFPHRIAPEKQHDIFLDLANALPEYKFVTCQDQNLSKSEYHALLAKSKIVFSANLQETLGISPYEGALLGAVPMLPDRLSYTEMYPPKYLYPSKWTENWQSYIEHKTLLTQHIKNTMNRFDYFTIDTHNQLVSQLEEEFFTATPLITELMR